MQIALSVVFIVLLVLVVYIMVCSCRGKAAQLFGNTVVKVVTGSMKPSIHEGDYISVKKINTSRLKKGDIISFYSDDKQIEGMINTHRIIAVNSDGTFVTKGDANSSEDNALVRSENVIGVYNGKIRFFRWLNSFASPRKLLLIFVMIPVILITIFDIKNIAGLKVKNSKDNSEKEKLIREAIDKEKQRLYDEYSKNKKEADKLESRENNESKND